MIPIDPAFEQIEQGSESCPVCCSEQGSADRLVQSQPHGTLWFRLPRLRRQKGLATGIIGLW
jgi:hypothetical protein